MRPVYELFIIVVVCLTWVFVYQNYWDDIKRFFDSGEPYHVVYLGDVALEVTVADDSDERVLGLSGTESLRDFEGKLFIFEEAGNHGIWMKDMLIPIDVLWFNDDLELIHVERNMTPESYPQVYSAPEPARFVLETNAYFVDSLQIEPNSRLIVPPGLLPKDVKDRLQGQ